MAQQQQQQQQAPNGPPHAGGQQLTSGKASKIQKQWKRKTNKIATTFTHTHTHIITHWNIFTFNSVLILYSFIILFWILPSNSPLTRWFRCCLHTVSPSFCFYNLPTLTKLSIEVETTRNTRTIHDNKILELSFGICYLILLVLFCFTLHLSSTVTLCPPFSLSIYILLYPYISLHMCIFEKYLVPLSGLYFVFYFCN